MNLLKLKLEVKMLEDELREFGKKHSEVYAIYKKFESIIDRDVYHFFVRGGFGMKILNLQIDLYKKKLFFSFSVFTPPATPEKAGLKNSVYISELAP